MWTQAERQISSTIGQEYVLVTLNHSLVIAHDKTRPSSYVNQKDISSQLDHKKVKEISLESLIGILDLSVLVINLMDTTPTHVGMW